MSNLASPGEFCDRTLALSFNSVLVLERLLELTHSIVRCAYMNFFIVGNKKRKLSFSSKKGFFANDCNDCNARDQVNAEEEMRY